MSTDFDVICHKCKKAAHLGQRMGATYSFGNGATDKEGQALVAKFIFDHMHDDGSKLEISLDAPEGYEYVEYSDLPPNDLG